VGVTDAIASQIQRKFMVDETMTSTILNGVDLKSPARSDGEKPVIRKKLGLNKDEKVIGIVANLKKIKNHIFLLRAFRELLKEYRDVKLLLIGQGFKNDPESSEQQIREYIDENELKHSVFLLGYRSDIPEILSIMDIFCLTSVKEGLPISLIEAMAAGLPIVGTDVEGIRDAIIQNKTGFLIDINDMSGLKNALVTLLESDSLRQRMGHQSRRLAEGRYSMDKCINEYQDLFLSVLESVNSRKF
jgi:glycosyltransferase involved in cell wall biosynthesis